MIKSKHWFYATSIALLLHLTAFVVWASVNDEGAKAPGELGVEIDLGMLGDLGEATETLEAAEISAPPEAETPKEEVIEKPDPLPKPDIQPDIVKQTADVQLKSKKEPPKPKKVVAKVEPKKVELKQAKVSEKSVSQETSLISTTGQNQQAQTKVSTGRGDTLSNGGQVGAHPSYISVLVAKLAKHKRYPLSSRRANEEGVVTLQFVLDKTGRVLSSSIKQSSGFKKLDDAVLKMLRMAQPLPAFSPEMQQESLAITLPIAFHLKDVESYGIR